MEVVLSCDTRFPCELTWFHALQGFRVAWAAGCRSRMYVDLVGNVPACFKRRSMWWLKVFAAQRLLKCRRVKSLLWLDTDATIAPILAPSAHRAAAAALQFPSLHEIWDNAMAKIRLQPAAAHSLPASGGAPPSRLAAARSLPRGGASLPASGGGVCARGRVPADGGDPFFLGYREKCQGQFNAGVWMVMNGPRARQFLHDWASLYPGDAWVPTSKWHTVPGFEQYEFNRRLITRLGVALLPEEMWCSRLSKGTTPLFHFYGMGPFTGKAAIGNYAIRTYAALSLTQRKRLPEMALWATAFAERSGSPASKEFLRAQRRNRPANIRKRPACGGALPASKRRRSTQPAGSGAKPAARRRQPA